MKQILNKTFFYALMYTMVLLISTNITAQSLTQTIRGTIIDQDTKMAAIGATVFVVGSDPLIGTTADIEGNFRLEKVPVGRVTVRVTYMGYEDKTISNLQLTSGKELILEIPIIEDVSSIEAVVVTAKADKRETNNEMSLVSSRTFSVEETKRYAGAINDPARAVSAFAGVNNDAEGNNDIVVRGNSPKGILWRLEGIEIPNPNHFSEEGSTGGAISALNSAMLANSDFSTGAFAPEYGNALSGVFDMKLRTGNNEQREYTFGLGVLGTDITMEGPFKKGGKSSYIANYRYSSLALLDNAGIVDFGGVPKYQDGAFKLRFPTKKAGIFTAFGFGGLSNILDQSYNKTGDTLRSQSDFRSGMGIAGISNLYFIGDNTYLETKVSASNNASGTEWSSTNDLNQDFKERYNDGLSKTSLRGSTELNHKFNAKNKLQSGLIYTNLNYNLTGEYLDETTDQFVKTLNDKGNTGYFQAYSSWKHRLTKDITFVGGVHYMHLMLNNTNSIEPRISANWKINKRHTVNAGFGVHSKAESLLSYFAQVEDERGASLIPNRDLELPKANHYVVGYDYAINENAHVKVEGYYQQLYDMWVENDVNSSFANLNTSDWFRRVEMSNAGTGRNYGMELTVERFFAKQFYYLVTASLYDSKYTAMDGVERNTRYNGNYTTNFLIGKEFKFGKTKNKVLSTNTKVSYIGGGRYTPIDAQASLIQDEAVFEDNPWGAKAEDIFILNFGATLQINRKKTTHSIKLEILNATNNQAKLYEYWSGSNQEVRYGTQLNMIPNIMYQVQF